MELLDLVATMPNSLIGAPRRRRLLVGMPCRDWETADPISGHAFTLGLLVETCGVDGEEVKLAPSLAVTDGEIDRAVEVLRAAIEDASRGRRTSDG